MPESVDEGPLLAQCSYGWECQPIRHRPGLDTDIRATGGTGRVLCQRDTRQVTGGHWTMDDEGSVNEFVVATMVRAPPNARAIKSWVDASGAGSPFVARLILAASASLTTLGIILYLENRAAPGASQFFDPVGPAVALTAPAMGAAIISRGRYNPIGWLLCAGGFVAVAFFAEQYAVYALVSHRGSLPGGTWMAWLGSWAWMLGVLPLTSFLLLLFPHGELPSPRWRPLAWVVLATLVVAIASAALAPDSAGSPSSGNPAAITSLPQLSALARASTGFSLLLAPLCLAGLLARYRRTPVKQRIQVRWFLVAAVLAVAAPFAGFFLPLGLHQALGVCGLVGLSAGIGVGVVKYRLYSIGRREINVLTDRAWVYVFLLVAAPLIYWTAVLLLDAGSVEPGLLSSAMAAAVAAVACLPLWVLLSDLVERLRTPRRAYQALIGLGHCLESSIVPDEVLPELANTIATALELPYVAVEVGREDEVTAAAVHGEPREEGTVVPLVHRHEVVGRLTVAPWPGESLHAADVRLLGDLASQAGAAVYGVRLTADLRLSKERLLAAREDEWRHVRRELHDRLGPLDGILLGIGAAGNIVDRADSEGAAAILARLKKELRSEIADIRALIEQLRPRSLDELGLVGALQRQAGLEALPPRPLDVTVEAGDLGSVSAAVEVAAYQIAREALTNVKRHAAARRCTISLAVSEGWLELEVADDGVGLPPTFQEGVGLCTIQERAYELGGTYNIERRSPKGTRVCVEIPLENL